LTHYSDTSRGSSLAGTAGVIVALVAVAAMTSGVANARMIPVETRSTLSESQAVRAVAAAVAQVARELAGAERLVATMPESMVLADAYSSERAEVVSSDLPDPIVMMRVGERLLDLPPPGR